MPLLLRTRGVRRERDDAETSVGVAFNNLGLAWAGGALTGAALAYWKKSYIYLLLGPLGGYVAGAPAFDIYEPWQMFLVALGAPIACYAVYEFSQSRGWDEHKLTPLFLGAGVVRAAHGRPRQVGRAAGRIHRLDEGTYAFQNAEVNVFWQAIGIVVAIGLGVVTAAVMAFILERTIGLRLSEEEQVAGVDGPVWGLDSDSSCTRAGTAPACPGAPASGAPTTVPASPSSEYAANEPPRRTDCRAAWRSSARAVRCSAPRNAVAE